MSHLVPNNPIPSTNVSLAKFAVQTDSGTATVSGLLGLVGGTLNVSTAVLNSTTVAISVVGPGSGVVFLADSGTATQSGGLLYFTTNNRYIQTVATGNTINIIAQNIAVESGGTGLTVLTTFGVLIGEGSNNVGVTAAGTSGQILIASTTGDPAFATITSSGNSIAFTAGPNSLNIEAVSTGGLTWQLVSTSSTLVNGRGYICIGGGTLTFALPASPSAGEEVAIAVYDPASSWAVELTNETIQFGYFSTNVALQSSAVGDVATLVCVSGSPTPSWIVINNIGNLYIM